MLDLMLENLTDIGYAAALLVIVWLANFLLDVYYNVKMVHRCRSCKIIYEDVIRFLAVCAGVTLLTIAVSAFPKFISLVGFAMPEEYVDVMSMLTIIALFARGIYEYTARAVSKLNSILKDNLDEKEEEQRTHESAGQDGNDAAEADASAE